MIRVDGGLTVLDTVIVAGTLDATQPHHAASRAGLARAARRGDRFLLPSTAYASLAARALGHRDDGLAVIDDLLTRLAVVVAPVDLTVAREMAALMAREPALRFDDAVLLGVASVHRAAAILTVDRPWPRARTLGLRCRIERVGAPLTSVA